MHLRLISTSDGSHSLINETLNESYHSIYGAVQESMHVFIDAGFRQLPSRKPNILEIGFGTGLNAFLTFIEAEKTKKPTQYISIELFPLKIEMASQLNYPEILKQDKDYFMQLHECQWGKNNILSDYFSLNKIKIDLQQYIPEINFDLVYFDAFSPGVQPELWSYDILRKISEAMNPGAILVTYSCMGMIKRNLIQSGLKIEKIPGPAGKREMIRARK